MPWKSCVRSLALLVILCGSQGCLSSKVHRWSQKKMEARHSHAFVVSDVHRAAVVGDHLFLSVDGRYSGGTDASYTWPYRVKIDLGETASISATSQEWGQSDCRADVRPGSIKKFEARYEEFLVPVMHVSGPVGPEDVDGLVIDGQLVVLDELDHRLLYRGSGESEIRDVAEVDDWVHTVEEPFERLVYGGAVGTTAVVETAVGVVAVSVAVCVIVPLFLTYLLLGGL